MTAVVVLGATGNQGSAVLQHLHAHNLANPLKAMSLFACTRGKLDLQCTDSTIGGIGTGRQNATRADMVAMHRGNQPLPRSRCKASWPTPPQRSATCQNIHNPSSCPPTAKAPPSMNVTSS